MEIDPKRSKFKKITTNYKQDNIMDIIDVEGSLSKNRFITKCDLFNFIYNEDLNRRCLNEVRENTIKLISSSSDNLVKINQNNFGIQVDELQFKTSEGLIVKLIDKYVPLKLIGQGAFGIVISAWDMRKSTKIAIKIIKKENFGSAMEKYLDNEMKIQMKLDNDRILTLFEVSDNPDYLYLFTELMEGGSLRDLIVRRYLSGDEHLFRDDECATIMRGILEGVHYMHSKNILHRDLKPGIRNFNLRQYHAEISK